ncbi:microcystin-dependent protein [Bradyrhizobium sp. JR7.2]|uniref:phage tail protein n=1 Tax=Bradyrhizobium sp. JR7.2 TaxID=3156375 RepID=UPI0033954AA9
MPQSGVPAWSQTAATNATADSTVNWQEGMAPSAVNDSARAMMASLAKWRDDNAGLLLTGGTSTAYTLTSNTGFFSKATMNGAEIAVTIHTTNGASPTLNVDGLGADPIIIDTVSSTTPVPSATLLTGGVYTLVYYNTGNTWRLKDFYQLPFTVPIGGLLDYAGSTVPSSNFVFPIGQAISRTTYAACFALMGTTYGAGDGSSTFNVPDLTGRVVAMKEASATRLTSTYFGGNSTILGATGGLESHTLTTAQLASHSHANTLSDPGHNHSGALNTGAAYNSPGGATAVAGNATTVTGSSTTGVTITNASAGSGNAHNNTQPTIILNKLLRII